MSNPPDEGLPPTLPIYDSQKPILGRYKKIRPLGKGAMGEVFEVQDLQSNQSYALKRVPPFLAHDAGTMQGIQRNYSMVSRLAHPHIGITRFLERDPTSQEVFLILDLIRGITLRWWVERWQMAHAESGEGLPFELVIGIAEQLASALDYAHSVSRESSSSNKKVPASGILHCDLKPGNVMVVEGEEFRANVPLIKIIDFGLASEVQGSLVESTMGLVRNRPAGTPAYMAPEQLLGKTLTRGVDQWALAVIVYEMLAGYRPFRGGDISVLVDAIQHKEPEKPKSVTEEQWAHLARALQKDRRHRFPSCSLFVQKLADSSSSTTGVVRLPLRSFQDTDSRNLERQSFRRPSFLRISAIIIALSVLVFGGYGIFRWFDHIHDVALVNEVVHEERQNARDPDKLGNALWRLRMMKNGFPQLTKDEAEDLNRSISVIAKSLDLYSRGKQATDKMQREEILLEIDKVLLELSDHSVEDKAPIQAVRQWLLAGQ